MPTELQELKQQITETYSLVEAQTKKWELLQRKAIAYSQSNLVPAAYRNKIEKKNYGEVTGYDENPSGLSNCIIAIDMAQRMNANELMVMQHLYIVEGRPAWSSQWIIAMINGCGRFSPLRFELVSLGNKEVEYTTTEWKKNANGKSEKVQKQNKVTIENFSCVAWAIEKETGERIESSKVTIEMAVAEGWYSKNGSKWQTMPEVMLRYRAASFFGKIYAPELLMGLQSVEESQDCTVDLSQVYPNAVEIKPNPAPNTGLAEAIKAAQPQPTVVDSVDQATGEVLDPAEAERLAAMSKQLDDLPDATGFFTANE